MKSHHLLEVALLCSAVLATVNASEPIRLVVRGDDMGCAHAENVAVIQAYRGGIVTSAEVLVMAPWFPEAVRLLAENPGLDAGVHLALTSEWDNVKWRPLTSCPSLTDASGYFYPMVLPNPNYPGRSVTEQAWKIEEIEREFRAQIELAKRLIPRLSHISEHMGCVTFSPVIAAVTRKLAREYHLTIDLPRVENAFYLGSHGTAEEKIASFIKMLESLQPGGTYCFVDHPGLDTPEMRAIHHVGYEGVAIDRQGVTDTMTDPRVKEVVRKRNISLVSYKNLAQ